MPTHRETKRLLRMLPSAVVMALGLAGAVAAKDPFNLGELSRHVGTDGVETITTPALKTEQLVDRHIAGHKPGHPLRIGEPFELSGGIDNVGTWSATEAGDQIWRLRIESPNARSINFGFSRFHLPQGAQLLMSNGSGSERIRPFTAADNMPHGQLWTPMVEGEVANLELRVPAGQRHLVELEFASINAGFVDFNDPFASTRSGACNVDVVCPQGDQWRDQIRSVGAYTRGGVDYCSGALVNNVRGDGTPYFLTANHCASTAAHAASIVIYWNYQNSVCRAPGSAASGQPGDGLRNQFNTGTTLRATNSASDFTLLETLTPINPAFEPYWSGVDATGATPNSTVAIHHPGVEEKRISFEDQPLTIAAYLGAPASGTSHWRVEDWDLGTTEGGSSGSPIFTPLPGKRIIGQLHGGYAACGNDLADWYGRVSVSWNGGGTAATQLKAWLDPDNTGALQIDGRGSAPFSLQVDPPAVGICAAEGSTSITIAIGQAEPGFTDPVAISFSGTPTGSTASLTAATVTPPGTSTLNVTGLGSATPGSYSVAIEASSGGDELAVSVPFELSGAAPGASVLVSPADNSTGHSANPTLSWTADPGAFEHRVEVATDAAFTNVVFDNVVSGSSVAVPALSTSTWYYWRVTAANFCGDASASSVFSFRTQSAPGDCDEDAVPVSLLSENFSGGLGSFVTTGSTGAQTWAIAASPPAGSPSAGNAVLAVNIATVSDQRLISPAVTLPTDQLPLSLQFWNHQALESRTGGCWDGGILEVTTNAGGTWTQVTGAAILNRAYDGPIGTGWSNPLIGLNAWCGNVRPWENYIIDLNAYAGQTVQFRWRLGTDSSVGMPGWHLDDIKVQACEAKPKDDTIFADGFEGTP